MTTLNKYLSDLNSTKKYQLKKYFTLELKEQLAILNLCLALSNYVTKLLIFFKTIILINYIIVDINSYVF